MKKLRIAQVGTMHDHAWLTYDSIRRLSDDFDLVGVAEIEDGREERLYPEVPHYTVEQLLEMDLDAVAIETEEERATEYAQMFADRGVHVHMDKPGSPNRDTFNHLADTMKERGLVFQLGYMYRYNPVIADTIRRVKAGELGDIYAVEAHMSVHHDIEKHRWLCKYPAGMMYFLGCHLVDLIVQLQGEPDEVIALNSRTGQDVPECEDYGFAVLKYKNGVSFAKTCSAELNGFDRRQIVVCGTKGTIEIKPTEAYIPNAGVKNQKTCWRMTDTQSEACWGIGSHFQDSEPYNRYDGMMHAFAAYIRGEEVNPYTYDYEKKVFDIFMKCCGVN